MTAGTPAGVRRATLHPEAAAILLPDPATPHPHLWPATQVDRAHVVMLVEAGLMDRSTGLALLGAIHALRDDGFEALAGVPAPRGWYLQYEGHLADVTGPTIGGALHLARSRNDLNATVQRLELRAPVLAYWSESCRLLATLVRAGRRYEGVVMPAFTHLQPAVPTTYGHYLAGVATSLVESMSCLSQLADELDRSPLGAGAIGGTSLPIDPARTAQLLGFTRPPASSYDAVASRDLVLRLLAAASITGVLVSRVAGDLLLWSTSDFGLLSVGDLLTGGSSMMPQKRNVFVLEHAQGRAAAALGAFTAAAAAMHKAPFTNSIAVHAEGAAHGEDGLRATREAMTLLRLVVRHASPQPERMLLRAETGATVATEAANRLATEGGLGFRVAHGVVAEALAGCGPGPSASGAPAPSSTMAAAGGDEVGSALIRAGASKGVSLGSLSPPAVARACEFGGGPGPRSVERCLQTAEEAAVAHFRALRSRRAVWSSVEGRLRRAEAAL